MVWCNEAQYNFITTLSFTKTVCKIFDCKPYLLVVQQKNVCLTAINIGPILCRTVCTIYLNNSKCSHAKILLLFLSFNFL